MDFRYKTLVAAILAVTVPAFAQQQASAPAGQSAAPAAKTFSQQELDELLAPIALYPDALLAQVLMASPGRRSDSSGQAVDERHAEVVAAQRGQWAELFELPYRRGNAGECQPICGADGAVPDV